MFKGEGEGGETSVVGDEAGDPGTEEGAGGEEGGGGAKDGGGGYDEPAGVCVSGEGNDLRTKRPRTQCARHIQNRRWSRNSSIRSAVERTLET